MQYQLFIPIEKHLNANDFELFKLCNQAARLRYWRHRGDFYLLKTTILHHFATRDGFDLHEFYSFDSHSCSQSFYATHQHILARFLLYNAIFHRPTSAFRYSQEWTGIEKQSQNFEALAPRIKNKICGKTPLAHSDLAYLNHATQAFQKLHTDYKFLLH